MSIQTFESSANPHIIVRECMGDLAIKGEVGSTVKIRTHNSETEDVNVSQEDNTFVLNTRADCRITCPPDTQLTLENVHGDLRVKMVRGALNIGTVNGDASLKDVGATIAAKIFGDLRARQVAGYFNAESIYSDANITEVAGALTLKEVKSDFKADAIAQNVAVAAVGADAILGPNFSAGSTYQLVVGSDLIVRLPEEASMHFVLQAGGGIRNRYPGLEFTEEQGTLTGTLSEGATAIEAQVGGRVIIKGANSEANFLEDFDLNLDLSFLDHLDAIGPIIEARVSEAMAELDVHLQQSLQHIDGDRIRIHIERVAEKAERAAARVADRTRAAVERETERARRSAAREAERARMRAEHAERRWQRASGHRGPTPPTPPTPTPPLDAMREERLQVLRMVEEGKLSPDEAAKLLAALR